MISVIEVVEVLKRKCFWGERVAGRERKKRETEKWRRERESVYWIGKECGNGLPLANEKAIMTTTEKHSNVSDWFDKAILCRGMPLANALFCLPKN